MFAVLGTAIMYGDIETEYIPDPQPDPSCSQHFDFIMENEEKGRDWYMMN